MKKYISLILIFSVSTIILYGQNRVQIHSLNEYFADLDHEKRTQARNVEMTYNDVEGSAYLYDFFMPGRIIMRNGKIFEGPLKFNLYTEVIEFQTDDQSVYSVSNSNDVKTVIIGEYEYSCVYVPDDPTKFIFMQLVYDGTTKIYLRQTVAFRDKVAPQAYSEGTPARFVRNKDRYYLSFPDLKYVEITSVKTLLNSLNDESGKLKKYIKENKLKTDNPEDLFKIMSYYEKSAGN
jgi:hypothetical protein